MSTESPDTSRPLPTQPNLRHLRDQARDLLKAGSAESLTAAQFQIARQYGFASWPKLKAHVESLHEVGELKQAIDTNNFQWVKALMSQKPSYTVPPWAMARMAP
jgi:hypothetical protein